MPVLLLTWEGGPPTDIDFRLYKTPGRTPRTTLNIFGSNSHTLVSLMVSPHLNYRSGWTHVKSGSTHMRRRISITIWDTTEFLLYCSVLGRQEGWVEEPWTESWMGDRNVPRTQPSTGTTRHADDDTNADDDDMPDTYEHDYYFEQDYPTGGPPGYDEVHR